MWDKDGVVIIPDHYIFTADPRANRNVDILREFVKQQVGDGGGKKFDSPGSVCLATASETLAMPRDTTRRAMFHASGVVSFC